ncbi:hypothetical protein NUW58_g5374 [Xylaria curta]|uniref:Uncharacterized protein n=1 Tax=Xylaria curta TaxID=42375 RepID=A0ACC1P356_9PEZI|nr:hypothetical protein NUW58_g5374 [Xylaria curta]
MPSLLQHMLFFLAATATVLATPYKPKPSACKKVRERVPWHKLTKREKSSYIKADLCLMNSPSKGINPSAITRWDDLQWSHVVQTTTVHGVGAFLPFHRYMLTAHERLIREECGYTGRMPYWDELHDINDVTASELWKEEYFGGDGTGPDGCIEIGPFRNLTLIWHPGAPDDEPGKYRRVQCQFQTIMMPDCAGLGGHAAALGLMPRAMPPSAALMADPTLSPGDPVFYLHHAWLDKLWWEWQKRDLPKRYKDMAGPNLPIAGDYDTTSIIHNDTYPAIDPAKADLTGKAVFISGATKGIGKGISISFAKAGGIDDSHRRRDQLSARRPRQ